MKPTPRLDELTARFQAAVANEPEWWPAHVRKAKPGEPLDWDPRLGLSREEYAEFLRLLDRIDLVKVRSFAASVRREGDRSRLEFGRELPSLRHVEIDAAANTVATPFGVLKESAIVTAEDRRKFLKQWDWQGVEWNLDKPGDSPTEGTSVSFTLGRLTESGRGIIYYSATDAARGKRTQVDYILQYDLRKRD